MIGAPVAARAAWLALAAMALDKTAALLVADDAGNMVWRVSALR